MVDHRPKSSTYCALLFRNDNTQKSKGQVRKRDLYIMWFFFKSLSKFFHSCVFCQDIFFLFSPASLGFRSSRMLLKLSFRLLCSDNEKNYYYLTETRKVERKMWRARPNFIAGPTLDIPRLFLCYKTQNNLSEYCPNNLKCSVSN